MIETPERLPAMLETVAGVRDIVLNQTRQIDLCLDFLKKQRDDDITLPSGDPDVFRVILPMIHMVGISGHSLLKLTDDVRLTVRDAFPVSRGIIEGVINICFIMAEGAETASRASRHAEVKAYRDLSRDWAVGCTSMTVGFSGQLPANEIARLDSMLPEFTRKNGREKDWTDLSLKQRLEAVASKFPSRSLIALNASALNIYRHASEISHGSYFGAAYFWGATFPGRSAPRNSDELRLTLVDHQFSVLSSATFAYAGLVECFADYVGIPELRAAADSELNRLHALPAIADALAAETDDDVSPS